MFLSQILGAHVHLHYTTALIFLRLFVLFLRLPLNRVPSRFWVISHMFWQWVDSDVFCIWAFGRDGWKEWQGGHGITGGDGGVESCWPWHHNKISDSQSRVVSAAGSRCVSPLYLTSFFFPPSSTVCFCVNGAFTWGQDEICQTRTKAPAWKGCK